MFQPDDDPNAWMLAKMWANISDASMQLSVVHLGMLSFKKMYLLRWTRGERYIIDEQTHDSNTLTMQQERKKPKQAKKNNK